MFSTCGGRGRCALWKALSALLLVAVLQLITLGCREEKPLGDETARFKKEVLGEMDRLAESFTLPVAAGDERKVQALLATTETRLDGQPFGLTILNANGVTLASTLRDEGAEALNFSRYRAVSRALKEGRVVHQMLYMQQGPELYVVCAPLFEAGEIQGVLAISFDSSEVKDRWGISEEEFLGMDFKR
jgi:hypothetical protein